MSKIYNMIETHVYRSPPDQNEDNIVIETRLNLKIKLTMNASEFYQTSCQTHSTLVDRETENALLDNMTSTCRKNIIAIVYGSYVDELQEINAMLWKNDDRNYISQKINKMIESMQGSE